jgi:hypothetical protein
MQAFRPCGPKEFAAEDVDRRVMAISQIPSEGQVLRTSKSSLIEALVDAPENRTLHSNDLEFAR